MGTDEVRCWICGRNPKDLLEEIEPEFWEDNQVVYYNIPIDKPDRKGERLFRSYPSNLKISVCYICMHFKLLYQNVRWVNLKGVTRSIIK